MHFFTDLDLLRREFSSLFRTICDAVAVANQGLHLHYIIIYTLYCLVHERMQFKQEDANGAALHDIKI